MLNLYTLAKAFHIAAAVIFVAGAFSVSVFLTTLPAREALSADLGRAATIVRSWDQTVVVPAMILTWALGITLAQLRGWFHTVWLPSKLLFVVIISALHGIQSGALRRAVAGRSLPRQRWFAAPMILASTVTIVIFVVVKPFS